MSKGKFSHCWFIVDFFNFANLKLTSSNQLYYLTKLIIMLQMDISLDCIEHC